MLRRQQAVLGKALSRAPTGLLSTRAGPLLLDGRAVLGLDGAELCAWDATAVW